MSNYPDKDRHEQRLRWLEEQGSAIAVHYKVFALQDENKRLKELYREAALALRATDALLDPLLMEHRNRIDDNAPIIAALQEVL